MQTDKPWVAELQAAAGRLTSRMKNHKIIHAISWFIHCFL